MNPPTVQELYHLLEKFDMYTEDDDPDKALVQKIDKWLFDLTIVEQTPAHQIRLAVETAEAAGPIEAILAVSTAHVSKETGKALDLGELPLTCHTHGQDGWMIYVNSEETLHADELPEELVALIAYARARKCCWLLLDSAATELTDMKVFEW